MNLEQFRPEWEQLFYAYRPRRKGAKATREQWEEIASFRHMPEEELVEEWQRDARRECLAELDKSWPEFRDELAPLMGEALLELSPKEALKVAGKDYWTLKLIDLAARLCAERGPMKKRRRKKA